MGKFNLVSTLSLNAAGMSDGLKQSVSEVEAFVDASKSANSRLNMSFRDVSEMGIGEMRKELMKLKNVSFAGKTKEEIFAINSRIGELMDTMGDLKAQQKGLGTEFGTAMAGGLRTVAAIGEVAVGAASLFGASKEQAEKYQQVMVSLIGVTQAMGTIEDALSQKQFQAIAVKIKSLFLTQAQTAATAGATTATAGFNAVLMANPVILVTASVAALVFGLAALGGAFSENVVELDKTSEAYQDLINKQKELIGMSTDLAASNDDAVKKMLISSGAMTEKQYEQSKVLAEKERKLKEVNAKEYDAIRAAQVSFEKTAGYTFAMLEADKAKAVTDANAARAEIIKEAYLSEQALNKETKKGTVESASAYDALTSKIADINGQIQDYILLGKDASKLVTLKVKLEAQKEGVDAVFSQMSLRDTGGLISIPEGAKDQAQDEIDAFIDDLDIQPIPVKLEPIKDDFLLSIQDKVSLATVALTGLSDAFVNMAAGAEVSFKAVVQSVLSGIRQVIVSKLAEALANQIAANSKLGLPGLALAGIGITGVMALFASLPKFAGGGIVGGSAFSGDNVLARVNSREMILSPSQQATLFDIANGGGGGMPGTIYLRAEGSDLVGVINRHSRKLNSYS